MDPPRSNSNRNSGPFVKDGIDVSIRVGPLSDSSLVARKICDAPRLLVASQDYIAF